jgi:hypothetical protein
MRRLCTGCGSRASGPVQAAAPRGHPKAGGAQRRRRTRLSSSGPPAPRPRPGSRGRVVTRWPCLPAASPCRSALCTGSRPRQHGRARQAMAATPASGQAGTRPAHLSRPRLTRSPGSGASGPGWGRAAAPAAPAPGPRCRRCAPRWASSAAAAQPGSRGPQPRVSIKLERMRRGWASLAPARQRPPPAAAARPAVWRCQPLLSDSGGTVQTRPPRPRHRELIRPARRDGSDGLHLVRPEARGLPLMYDGAMFYLACTRSPGHPCCGRTAPVDKIGAPTPALDGLARRHLAITPKKPHFHYAACSLPCLPPAPSLPTAAAHSPSLNRSTRGAAASNEPAAAAGPGQRAALQPRPRRAPGACPLLGAARAASLGQLKPAPPPGSTSPAPKPLGAAPHLLLHPSGQHLACSSTLQGSTSPVLTR